MSRDILFDPELICDICKDKGAFDFMGDFLCDKCAEGEEEGEICKLKDRVKELEAGIEAIAPWLSASLTEHTHDGKGEYLKACNEIFRLD